MTQQTRGRPLVEVLADPPPRQRAPTIAAQRKHALERMTGY